MPVLIAVLGILFAIALLNGDGVGSVLFGVSWLVCLGLAVLIDGGPRHAR